MLERKAFRFSDRSERARACGEALLELTAGYEDLIVPADVARRSLAVVGIAARGRHLLKTAYLNADAGDVLGSALAIRALTESVLTQAWFNKDLELAELIWTLDEIRNRLSQHKEVADDERRERRRSRYRGDVVEPLPAGQSFGILDRHTVRHLKQLQTATRRQAGELRQRQRRLERLKVRKGYKMPGFRERAQVAGLLPVYSIAYRFDSNATAHRTSSLSSASSNRTRRVCSFAPHREVTALIRIPWLPTCSPCSWSSSTTMSTRRR